MEMVPTPQQQTALNLLALFRQQLEKSSEICDMLESMADDLPRRSATIWRTAKHQCRQVLEDHITLGSELIIPTLSAHVESNALHRNVLSRFHLEYQALANFSDNLDDLLDDALSNDQANIGSEALGFALRTHFDLLRKTIGWELDVLEPMIKAIPHVKSTNGLSKQ